MTTLEQAIAFAQTHESDWDRDATGKFGVHRDDPPPWNRLYGPIHSRGPVSGVILHEGKELASWGEPDRADLTFSVAKMYLALLAGVAQDRGLLPDVDAPIAQRLPGIGFDEGNNAAITWKHMLQQPLPDVFREEIMRPVGASENWQWVGYDDSWVDIAGKRVQSVTGGTHWGGGMSVSALDQSLVGQMLLNNGMAQGKRVLSSKWIAQMRTPCDLAPYYGYLIWLNHKRRMFPSLPASSYFGVGAGSSFTWVEPARRLLVIVRWLEAAHADALFGQILRAVD